MTYVIVTILEAAQIRLVVSKLMISIPRRAMLIAHALVPMISHPLDEFEEGGKTRTLDHQVK